MDFEGVPTMKKACLITAIAAAIFLPALVGCNAIDQGMAGNIYEKMTIFSMIVFVLFAVFFIPFISGKGDKRALARYRELVRTAAVHRWSVDELTSYPVYVWDSAKSFSKMLLAKDGSLSVSSLVVGNGIDPAAAPSGSWTLDSAGILRLSFNVTSSSRDFTCIMPDGYNLATLVRLNSGYAKAWHLGWQGLARMQISCFGYSASQPATEKFTASLLRGLKVYWASYPCVMPTASDEVGVNPELTFGMISFHEDGTLSKSINNPLDAVPDYSPAFTGTWQVDDNFGVLNLTVGLYFTQINLLLRSAEHHSLLVGSAAGNEQWFLDPEHAAQHLAAYLALGIYLDAGKDYLYLDGAGSF